MELLKVYFKAEFTMIRALIMPINQITEAARSHFPLYIPQRLKCKVYAMTHDEGVIEH